MFGDIPILMRMYMLHNIEPLSENGYWPEGTRDQCVELIIEKQCHLEVMEEKTTIGKPEDQYTHEEYDKCRLGLFNKHKDLATVLVARGFAKYIEEPSSFIIDLSNKL